MKINALKNRSNINSLVRGGIDEKVFQEIIQEYENKIKTLESQIVNNVHVRTLKDKVQELMMERDRLIKALELNCDRTFFTKQMNANQ